METPNVHRRENIVLTTVEYIHKYGIQSVSTKEIAKILGISESTIFKHFPKKNDLIMAVLEQFSLYDKDIFTTANNVKNPVESILFYIDTYMTYYECYPQITCIVGIYDAMRGIEILEEKAKSILINQSENMKALISKAQDSDIISKKLNTEIITDIFTATFKELILKWRLNNFDFSLQIEALKRFEFLIYSFRQ